MLNSFVTTHAHTIYLKPGEVIVALEPVLVSTVLGSCVAVTMYSCSRGFGAICHAMLPAHSGPGSDFRYVDIALKYLYAKALEYDAVHDVVIKLFGGTQMQDAGGPAPVNGSVGEQNVAMAEEVLAALGLTVAARDTGGLHGRKLFFSTKDGNVYMRLIRSGVAERSQ